MLFRLGYLITCFYIIRTGACFLRKTTGNFGHAQTYSTTFHAKLQTSCHYLSTSRNAAKPTEPKYKMWNILRQKQTTRHVTVSLQTDCYRYKNFTFVSNNTWPSLTVLKLKATELKGERTYSGSPKYDDVEEDEVGLLLDDWHLQHWLPMPALPCEKDVSSPHLKSNQNLTCLTPRHRLLPKPHTDCHSACPSPEPESVNGYFCLSRARKSGMATNRDEKAFQRIISNDCRVFTAYMELFL